MSRRDGWVYVIGEPDSQTVKIGWTASTTRRLRELQASSPVSLVMRWCHPGDGWHETSLHGTFSDYRSHGEWFRFPAGEDPVLAVRMEIEALPDDPISLLVSASDHLHSALPLFAEVMRLREETGDPRAFPGEWLRGAAL
jgi:hypothetical protein